MTRGHVLAATVCVALSCATAFGAPEEMGYPRLAMWWPSSWRQAVEDLARYDLIAWGTWDREETLAEIKRLNPSQVHLVSMSLTETNFGSWKRRPELMGRIPAEWFLTQRGSSLPEAVDAEQTVIPVERTRAEDGTVLFAAGDTVACEYETMKVEKADHETGTLTVQRGYVRPAAAHAAGVRIAAQITFWPRTWVMNLSTMCPRVQVDPEAGPEMWVEWALRHLLPEENRDGFCVDRIEAGQSWLTSRWARSIDPDCSNRAVSDDYASFDRAWTEGIRAVYIPALRRRLGDLPIVSNTSGAFYDILNGCIFESFPGDWRDDTESYMASWARRALRDPGLFAAAEKSIQPNFTWVETYEREEGPAPDDTDGYDNPFTKPGFVPSYQRMRWGLTTALIAGAYFSYEINTQGHGSLGLMWFDEYDNAGQGRHYLGPPTGPAQLLMDFDREGRVYRRDFEHGVVICNPSEREVTVELGGTFRHIKGTQVPEVNNGRDVSSVTIAPMDGRILLR